MKLTQQQLKQLIKEELQKALKEVKCPAGCVPATPRCKSNAECRGRGGIEDVCDKKTGKCEYSGLIDERAGINEQRANPIALITNIITQLTRLKASLAPKKAATKKKLTKGQQAADVPSRASIEYIHEL